jgi:Uma2 family endonuclease
MLQTKTQLTLEEFLALPEGEGDITYELIDEQAVPKMSPKKFHSRLTRSLIKLLEQWGEERGEIGVDYLDAKVLRVWVVDSKARSITVFYPDAAPQTYMGDTLLKDPLFDGLEFTASQLFQMAKIP